MAAVALALACALVLPADSPAKDNTGESRAVEPLFGDASPRFGADLRASLSERGTAVGLDLELPYSELQFILVPGGYGAVVQVTVVFRAAKGGRAAGGDVWEERIQAPTYEATKDASARVRFRRSFVLEPGEYRVEITVEDGNGRRSSRARGAIEVSAFPAGALGLGDLEFGTCRADSTFDPMPSRRFESGLEHLCVRGSIYDRSQPAAAKPVTLAWIVRAETGETVAKGDTTVEASGSTPFVLRPSVANLFLGTYAIEVEAREGSRRWKTERSFEVETLTLPRGQSYATVVEVLSNIASDDEYDRLRAARGDSAQAAAWDTFWKRRDPTPDTPRNESLLEFYRRVRYANRTFAGQGIAGWRTDQGRVYIRNGAPDQVEDRPPTFYEPAYQVWQYFDSNRRYVFADREGFGRWELVSSTGDR